MYDYAPLHVYKHLCVNGVCACVDGRVHVCALTNMCGGQTRTSSVWLHHSPLYYSEMEALTEYAAKLAVVILFPSTIALRLYDWTWLPMTFYVGDGDPNLGPHAYVAVFLPTKPLHSVCQHTLSFSF